jgi:ketosteroid isomerase-like protein
MRKPLLLALLAAACATPPAVVDPESLAASETAFAAHSLREDMRVAFLAAFADDGVFVRNDGWAVSNDWLRDRPAPPIVLDWRPQYVETAGSGELGLSTGPWKVTSKTDAKAAPSFGQFVSIWRREPGGPWKVAVDLGISHPGDSLWNEPLFARAVPMVPSSSLESLAHAETRFARIVASSGALAGYEALAATDLRYYRTGRAPEASRKAALGSPAMGKEKFIWTVERMETARSGDFGYTRGHYADSASPQKTLGYFLRVWRVEAAGWRIILDVTNPAS